MSPPNVQGIATDIGKVIALLEKQVGDLKKARAAILATYLKTPIPVQKKAAADYGKCVDAVQATVKKLEELEKRLT
jgi:hypothetical protein